MSRKRQYDIVFESEIGDKRKDPDLEQFWRLEAIGITDNPKETSDELAEQRFRDTIRKVDNRWEVGWPFNEKFDLLPDNFNLAYGRLSSLARRLQQADPVVREEYAQVVDQQLKQGIIEVVPTTEIKAPSTPVHYLPHHAVLRVDHATTKVRVVYDASAKVNRQTVSLNECVHRGPVILPDLAKLLMKFRLNPVAVISNIEKAFLQISLRPQHRDVTRFLWFKDHMKSSTKDFRTMRFRRIPFGVISSPSLLGQVLQHHLKLAKTTTAKTVAEHLYVDNCIASLEDEKSAVEFYREAKSLFENELTEAPGRHQTGRSKFNSIDECPRAEMGQPKR